MKATRFRVSRGSVSGFVRLDATVYSIDGKHAVVRPIVRSTLSTPGATVYMLTYRVLHRKNPFGCGFCNVYTLFSKKSKKHKAYHSRSE